MIRSLIVQWILRFSKIIQSILQSVALGFLSRSAKVVYQSDSYKRIWTQFTLIEDRGNPDLFAFSEIDRLTPGKKMLDVFCGQGREAYFFEGRGYDVTGVDSSKQMIDAANHHKSEGTLLGQFNHADILEYSSSELFDVIFTSNNMYSNFMDQTMRLALLDKLKSFLKPNGIIVVSYLPLLPKYRLRFLVHHCIVRLVAIFTWGNIHSEFGDRLVGGYLIHYFELGEIESELANRRLKILARHTQKQRTIEHLILSLEERTT